MPHTQPNLSSHDSARVPDHLMPRLLVIDDDLVQRSIVCKLGAQVGYVSTSVATLSDAIQYVNDGSYDFDGVAALRRLAEAGCAMVQGRVFSRPLDEAALGTWIEGQFANCDRATRPLRAG